MNRIADNTARVVFAVVAVVWTLISLQWYSV